MYYTNHKLDENKFAKQIESTTKTKQKQCKMYRL